MLQNRKRTDNHLGQNFKSSLQRSRNFECKIFERELKITAPPTGFVCGCAETWKFRLSDVYA